MGKPRLIIVIRHAQSEGNKDRQIHQIVPDHRVKLTPHGWSQAQEAGRRLRAMLRPDDTLQFYTSPYRRTRETTEGILRELTSDEIAPSPFRRNAIKVWEEPRLREQDFGNFQPCSARMEQMWQERADYGHFFYRIPSGESAADAYDRVSGFNESLWRSFGENDFASVCVLVTHGLMTRVFLMKWYHWSVEYFEDLRNIDHCEFVLMKRSDESGKFILQNELRTWSELRRQKEAEKTDEAKLKLTSPVPLRKRWGGCPDGCNHAHDDYPVRTRKQDSKPSPLPTTTPPALNPSSSTKPTEAPQTAERIRSEEEEEAFPKPKRPTTIDLSKTTSNTVKYPWAIGRDGGGSDSGAPSPTSDKFKSAGPSSPGRGSGKGGETAEEAREREREWLEQSGMASGARADALGDQRHGMDDADEHEHGHGHDDDNELARAETRDRSFDGSVY